MLELGQQEGDIWREVAILALVVLTISSAAFGNELEDRTLSNLKLNPVPRWKIVEPKLLASMTVSAPFLLASTLIPTAIAHDGDAIAMAAAAIEVAGTIAVYSALFLWVGFVFSRALGIRLLYVFLWEGLFSKFVNGIRFFSIGEYMLGLIQAVDVDRFAHTTDAVLGGQAAVIGGVAVVVFGVLYVHRLRTMDVP